MRAFLILSVFWVSTVLAADLWDVSATPAVDSSPVASSSSAANPDSSVQSSSSSSIGLSSSLEASTQQSSSSLSQSSSQEVSSSVLSSSSVGLSSSSEQSSSVQTSSSSSEPIASSSSSFLASSSSRSRADLLGTVKVSRVRSIDEMKGNYKSPRKALFLSLLVPGAGQLYVGGRTSNYVRGGLYVAAEATLFGLWYHYSVNLYDKQVKSFERYANSHFSLGRYESRNLALYNSLADEIKQSEFQKVYMSDRTDYCASLFRDPNANKCLDIVSFNSPRSFFPESQTLGEAAQAEGGRFIGHADLYRMIGQDDYVLGWDELSATVTAGDLRLSEDGSEWVVLGQSSSLQNYQAMRARANRLGSYQAYFLGGVILNHIVSAVDASIAAHLHNKGLYEEKIAWYERVRFDSGFHIKAEGLESQVLARLDF